MCGRRKKKSGNYGLWCGMKSHNHAPIALTVRPDFCHLDKDA